MSNQSDTPRTDKEEYTVRLGVHKRKVVRPELCREIEKELTAARAEVDHYIDVAQKATEDLIAVTEQRDRLAEALKEEMEWAKDQSHLCDKESVEREQKNDDLGSRYYDGLSVAFYQSMRRLQYRLMPLQSLTTNAERIHGEKDA